MTTMTAANPKPMSLKLDESEPRWFAVYTRYKREKMVFKRLNDQDVEIYVPLQKVTRRFTRKVKHLEIPLLPCYVFTRITKKDFNKVLADPDVVNFVRIAKEMVAIPEAQINTLRRVVGENLEIFVEPSEYQVGDRVEVIGGSLIGIQGVLADKNGQKFFVIELEGIGQSLRMQIEPKLLRVLGKTEPEQKKNKPDDEDGLFRKYS